MKRLMLRRQGQIVLTSGALNGFWFGALFFWFAAMAWGIIALIVGGANW